MAKVIEQTAEKYGIENWGAGYFSINRKGNLVVHPSEGDTSGADVKEIIDDLKRRGIHPPVLLRFPQLIVAQIRKLQRAFKNAIREYEYQGRHLCVYPMKVNQNRFVVEEYLKEGAKYDFGLEAGSKAELYAALAMEQTEDSLLILNGFKDEEFIRLAFAGATAGKSVVIVIEKMSELTHALAIAADLEAENPETNMPMLGVRVKLYSKGSGKWEKSGGEAAKFGLTTTEILDVIRQLNEAGKLSMLKLLHFHIGSQLTD
ncbi:MAG: arginine decarboxylase, partial [Pyrinomonadaceae bacterium]